MDKILIGSHTFTNYSEGDGKLLDGGFYLEDSLSEDGLSIDTLNFTVRFPLEGEPNLDLTTLPYGSPISYYQKNKLYGKFCLKEVKRTGKNTYSIESQSPIGLLDDSNHYGGIYNGTLASTLIDEIISNKIEYSVKNIFTKIKIYGWLPIATRRDNLKQLLFACGGCVAKDSNGDIYFTTLSEVTPTVIPDSKVMDSGSLNYDINVSKVEVTEHAFAKLDTLGREDISSGELTGSSFITPKGYTVNNANLVRFEHPYHSIEFTGCNPLNSEVGVNYAVVTASVNAKITGIPYLHSTSIITKTNPANTGTEKTAEVKEATLVSLANSGSTAERVMAYYGHVNTLSSTIILEGQKCADRITLSNPFGEQCTGFIKSIDGNFGNSINIADTEIILDYNPPAVVGSRVLTAIMITKVPSQTTYASGDVFNPQGMEVTAYYDDGTSQVVTNYSYSPNGALTKEDTQVTISYRELGVTKTTTQAIVVKDVLRRIAITNPPNQTAYFAGDTFSTAGMVVTAYYSNGSFKEVTNYTYSPTGALTEEDNTITVTYTEDGITVQTYQDITVGPAPNLVSISVTTPPNKVKYKVGEYFDSTGMVVTAYFDNETSRAVSGYTYNPNGALNKTDTTITISYTRGSITKTTTQEIQVIYLTGLKITNPPNKIEYYENENFDTTGMVVKAVYSDLSEITVTNYTVSPETLSYGDTSVTLTYTEGDITVTTTQAITVNYYPYDYTKSVVVTENKTITLAEIGATHKNIRIVAISGGNGAEGGTGGKKGANASNISLSKGSNGTSQATAGGTGGKGGKKGTGGKILAKDLYLPSLTTPIVISCGSKGIGGAGGISNTSDSENPTEGVSGTSGTGSSVTIGDNSYLSENGTQSATGYTDIFSSITYATDGVDGGSGANGGDGQSEGDGNEQNPNSGDNAGTNIGGEGGYRSEIYEKGSYISSYTQDYTYLSQGTPVASNTNLGYVATDFSFNTSTGVFTLKNYKNVTLTSTLNSYYVCELNTYSGRQGVLRHQYTWDSSSQKYKHYRVQYYSTPKYSNGALKYRYWGGGGGGASYNQDGSPGYLLNGGTDNPGQGGKGADGTTPNTPIYIGCGGSGGNGGGGGGGAGGAYATLHANSYTYNSYNLSGADGGLGGNGSKGADGAPGGVIIYYS